MLLIMLATLLGLAAPAWADAQSEFDAGMAAYNSSDLDTAVADYTKAIELKPDLVGPTITAATCISPGGSLPKPSPIIPRRSSSSPIMPRPIAAAAFMK